MFEVHKNILTISDSSTFIPVSTVHHYRIRYRAENFHRKQISNQFMKKSIGISGPVVIGQRSRKKSSSFHFLNLKNL